MPSSSGTQSQADFPTAASSAAGEPRQRGPLGEQLTDAELLPIRVHSNDGSRWQVDYGSYAQGYHDGREEAIAEALAAAVSENRELTIERPRRISETDVRTEVNETASAEFLLDDCRTPARPATRRSFRQRRPLPQHLPAPRRPLRGQEGLCP